MDILALSISQLAVGFVIAATLALVVWLIVDLIRKPRSVSGETYLYSIPSDDDFFDTITEFRNDISRK